MLGFYFLPPNTPFICHWSLPGLTTEASVQGGPEVGLAVAVDPQSPMVKTCNPQDGQRTENCMQGKDYHMVTRIGPPGA